MLGYYVEYINRNRTGKVVQNTIVYGANRNEVDIVIKNLYPLIYNSDEYVIGTGFGRSESLEKEGKVKYSY